MESVLFSLNIFLILHNVKEGDLGYIDERDGVQREQNQKMLIHFFSHLKSRRGPSCPPYALMQGFGFREIKNKRSKSLASTFFEVEKLIYSRDFFSFLMRPYFPWGKNVCHQIAICETCFCIVFMKDEEPMQGHVYTSLCCQVFFLLTASGLNIFINILILEICETKISVP